jgi:hypothetical protein
MWLRCLLRRIRRSSRDLGGGPRQDPTEKLPHRRGRLRRFGRGVGSCLLGRRSWHRRLILQLPMFRMSFQRLDPGEEQFPDCQSIPKLRDNELTGSNRPLAQLARSSVLPGTYPLLWSDPMAW